MFENSDYVLLYQLIMGRNDGDRKFIEANSPDLSKPETELKQHYSKYQLIIS